MLRKEFSWPAALLVLGGIALLSLGLWGTINFAFGGKATYGSIFASWMYAALPGTIKVLLGIVVIFLTTTPESFNLKNYAPTNIASFLNPLETNQALYCLAQCAGRTSPSGRFASDQSIGVATVAGVKKAVRAISSVFGWWIL